MALAEPAEQHADESRANGAGGGLPPQPPAVRRTGGGAPEGRAPTIYRRERSMGRMAAIAAGIVVVVVLLVVLLSSVLSKGGSPKSSNTASTTTTSSQSTNRSSHHAGASAHSVRVVVLNATQTNGAAAKVAGTLKGQGYSQASALFGTPSGSFSSTVVQYATGHEAEAKGVASALKLPSSDVQPLSSAVTPLSGGAPVVVIIGGSGSSEVGHSSGASEPGSSESEAGGETANGGEAPESQAEPGA